MDRSKFLQVGDVFRLAPGVRVDYEGFENRFNKDYSPFDTRSTTTYICVEKVYRASRNIELVRTRLFGAIRKEFRKENVLDVLTL